MATLPDVMTDEEMAGYSSAPDVLTDEQIAQAETPARPVEPPKIPKNPGYFSGLDALQKTSDFMKVGLDAGAGLFKNTFKAGMGAVKTFAGEAVGLAGNEGLSRKILAPQEVAGVGTVKSFSVDPRDVKTTGAASAENVGGIAAGMIPEAITANSLAGGTLGTAETAAGRIALSTGRGTVSGGFSAMSEAMQNDKSFSDVMNDTRSGAGWGGLFGFLTQGGIEGTNWLLSKIPRETMNTTLKAQNKEFAFGKDPGKGALDHNVVGRSIEETQANTRQALMDTGDKIGDVIEDLPDDAVIDPKPTLKKLDDLIARASDAQQQDLVDRYVDLKNMLMYHGELDPETGKIVLGAARGKMWTPKDAWEMKKLISDKTNWSWTGKATDSPVNKFLKSAYGALKDQINKVAEASGNGELVDLNEDYANLTSTKSALSRMTASGEKFQGIGRGLIAAVGGISGGGMILWGFSTGDTRMMGKGLATLAGTAAIQNPVVQMNVAQILNKMSPTEQKLLMDGATQPVRDFIGNVLSQKIGENAGGVEAGAVELPEGNVAPAGGDDAYDENGNLIE